MSTTYRPYGKGIRFDSLRAKVEAEGMEIDDTVSGAGPDAFPFCFAGSWLWAYRHGKQGTTFCRYGRNDVTTLIDILEGLFDVEIINEYDDRFFNRR